MYKHPAFFKFFIHESSNIKLKIPPAFIRSIDEALPKKIYLTCRSKNTWKIKVTQDENDWYFSDGWPKFVADSVVKSGDLLVFQYFCKNAFSVKLYGPNAIEKNLVGKCVHQAAAEREEHEQVPEEEEDDDDDDEETESEDYDDEETESEDYDDIMEVEEQVNPDGGDSSRNQGRRHRSTSADYYGAEIFTAGLAQQPENPYFVTTTRGKRKNDLYVPKDIARECNLYAIQEILLIDPRGREFSAECRKWKDGRVVIGKGWRRLCRLNLVHD